MTISLKQLMQHLLDAFRARLPIVSMTISLKRLMQQTAVRAYLYLHTCFNDHQPQKADATLRFRLWSWLSEQVSMTISLKRLMQHPIPSALDRSQQPFQ